MNLSTLVGLSVLLVTACGTSTASTTDSPKSAIGTPSVSEPFVSERHGSALSSSEGKANAGEDASSADSQPLSPDVTKENPGSTIWPAVWKRWSLVWEQKESAHLREMSFSAGVLLLDNPGASVRVRRLGDAVEMLALPGTFDGARLKELKFAPDFAPGEVPRPSCDGADDFLAGIWGSETMAPLLQNFVNALAEHQLAPPEKVAELQLVLDAARDLPKFVVHDASQNVRFIFVLESSQARLFAVDAVIPCSA